MNAIGFHVVGSQAETKATPTTSSNLKDTDFRVFAYKENGDIYMGGGTTYLDLLKGVQINHKSGKWDYADPTERHYWPSEALDFYAVNPATIADNMKHHCTWNINSNEQQIVYSCVDEYGLSSDPAENIDVMYAIAKDQKKGMNTGKVKLQFKHILSQVVFQAKANNTDMKVTIESIRIYNFSMGGTFTFPADATTAPALSNWVPSPKAKGPFTVVKDKSIIVDNATTATDISLKSPMLFFPQSLTAWDTSHPTTQADTNKESYLIITCKIQQSGSYLHGDATKFETLYVPFGASWEPGKRYIYTLIFGGGYNDQGQPILTPIDFDATVDEWGAESDNVDL